MKRDNIKEDLEIELNRIEEDLDYIQYYKTSEDKIKEIKNRRDKIIKKLKK